MTRFLRLATRITALLTLLPLTTLQAATLPAIEAQQGAVVSEQRLASAVGLQILQAGGNAVDAAVAMGYALAVVNPCCGNIGGGGFMTLHLANGKNTFINFREKAPQRPAPTCISMPRASYARTVACMATSPSPFQAPSPGLIMHYSAMARSPASWSWHRPSALPGKGLS